MINNEWMKTLKRINTQTDINLLTLISTFAKKEIKHHVRKDHSYSIPPHKENDYGNHVIDLMERYASMKYGYTSEYQESEATAKGLMNKLLDVHGADTFMVINSDFLVAYGNKYAGTATPGITKHLLDVFNRYIPMYYPEVRK